MQSSARGGGRARSPARRVPFDPIGHETPEPGEWKEVSRAEHDYPFSFCQSWVVQNLSRANLHALLGGAAC